MAHSKQTDARREAWRKFYLENYHGAVDAVGHEKKKIDDYIVSLWKSIGSKGREVYISAVQETAQRDQQSERGNEHAKSSTENAEHSKKPSEVRKLEHRKLESTANHAHRPLREDVKRADAKVRNAEKVQKLLAPTDDDVRSWPRQLTSRFCECVMLTRKKVRLSVDEIVSLSVSRVKESDRGKQPAPTVVRLNKDGREFARVDAPFASTLGAAMQSKLVTATCSIVQPPVGTGMFTAFYGEVFISIERGAFVESDDQGRDQEGIGAKRMAIIRMIRELDIIPGLGAKPGRHLNSESGAENGSGEGNGYDSYFSSVNRIEVTDAQDFEPPQNLRSSLREYQKAGVRWMINRENFGSAIQPSSENGTVCYYPWQKCKFETGSEFFVNAVTGELRLENLSSNNGGPRGGILADEMGLGKTVQCIACLLQDCEEDPSVPRNQPSDNSNEYEDVEQTNAGSREARNTNGRSVARPPAKKRKRNKIVRGAQGSSAMSLLMANARDSCALGGTLIICPTSLVTQWMDELGFHIKPNSLRIIAHYGNVRGDEASICAKFADIVVTSYGVLASEFNPGSDTSSSTVDPGPLFRLRWRRIILDEAHTIKSRSTRWAKAAYHLEAKRRWCVTGTVIHNHINDVYSLIHFLRLEPWSTWSVWSKSIAEPLESKDEAARESAMSLVRDVLSSIILRRKKSTKDFHGKSIVQMTKKSVQIVSITPSSQERNFYSALHARTKLKFNSFLAQGNVLKNYASVLEMLLRLRQACDHPYLVIKAAKTGNEQDFKDFRNFPDSLDFDCVTSKKRALEETDGMPRSQECLICLDITDSPVCLPECSHVFCRVCITEVLQRSRTCPLCKTPTEWKDADPDPNRGFEIDVKRWTPSAKIEELVKDLTDRQSLRKRLGRAIGKSVVFSQFVSMLDITEVALRRAKFSFLRIDGSVPQSKRAVILRQFSSERELASDACNVLLLSTRTGGVGLNLTSASFAVILDIHWNPQVDAQAQDRIHRHGQTKDVHIKRYIVKDSVEEKLLEVQARKEKLAEGALEEANESDEKQARVTELKLLFSG